MKKLSINTHLSKEDIIKNGSIFTPDYIVDLIVNQIKDKLNKNSVVIDFGAGYGAFCSTFLNLPHKRIIATDCDETSINFIKQEHDGVETILENSLININRNKYCKNNDELVVIGNPPYNDVTSQYKKGEKGSFDMDEDIYARDLGISFLKMYDKINAKYICVLHPLSYLCKKNNFKSLGVFKDHYKLVSGVLFSSKHFESIKNSNAEFPVIAALYERNSSGMTFDNVINYPFPVFGSDKTFKISSFKTIDGIVNKYPTKDKKDTDLQFYTIRDINALKRNKTFLVGKCTNGIKVNKEDLYLYAWLDLFKNNFDAGEYQYLFGNLSPLLSDKVFDQGFKDKLLAYIIKENSVVNAFYKGNDLEFFKRYNSSEYDKKELVIECMSLSKL